MSEGTPPILYFAPGSCARVPLIALEETGVAYELRTIAFMAGEHRRPEYLAINPSGKVPALVTEQGTITQNTAILLYLARRYPDMKLLPPADGLYGEVEQVAALSRFSADLHPIVTRIRMPQFFSGLDGAPADVRAKGCAAMALQLENIEAQLARQPWMLGDVWSVLDAYLFWVWFRIIGAGFDPSAFPAIAAHYAAMEKRPSVERMIRREAEVIADLEARGLSVPMN